jgi:uncharacterized protein involved in exopolysaccharide biosynthesis
LDPTNPSPGTIAPESDATDEVNNGPSVREWISFGATALRRHKLLAGAITVLVLLVGSAIVSMLPPQYETGFRIFVQDGSSITTALASGMDRSNSKQNPAERGMSEYLLARDNLLSVVREANVFDQWPRSRPLVLRIKDQLSASLFGPPQRMYMERGFMEMLAANVNGYREGESLRVFVRWRDPLVSYDLARLMMRNFLSARASVEFGPIQRALPFLEAQLEQADQAIEAAVQQMQAQKEYAWQANSTSGTTATPGATPASNPLGELTSKTTRLFEVRRKIKALSEPLSRRVAELEAQLADTRPLYGPNHPKLLQLEARLAAAREPSPELAELKQEETDLRKVIAAAASRPPAAASQPADGASNDGAKPATKPEAPAVETPGEMASAQARFYKALAKSQEIMARLDTARIELAAAQSEFDHKYVVIEEPEVPGRPLKNKKPMYAAGVVVAALVLALLAAVGRELASGRLRQEWQVRQLGLPVLAFVDLKQLPPSDQG